MIDENQIVQTIIMGTDWQEVLSNIVVEESLDPLSVDIIKLADSFTNYLVRLKTFDFRIPARFILIAAILLRMKCELILEEEPAKEGKGEQMPLLNIENIPTLSPPLLRRPTRKVTLDELVSALNKAFEFKEKKENKHTRLVNAIERLIEPEEDIEVRIKNVHQNIKSRNSIIKFSDLVPKWKRDQIVYIFMPILYLQQRKKISATQEEMFSEIYITLKEDQDE